MKRPFVYVNMAMTVDGKITSAKREYPTFSGPADRSRMDRLRAEADAILVGAGTLRADNPELHVRDDGMRRHRESLGKPPGLVHVVVSASGRLDGGWHAFDASRHARAIVATVEELPQPRRRALEAFAEVWPVGAKRVDLARLLQQLHGEGVRRLLLEGGAELNWQMFAGRLVDELNVTISPAVLGGRDAPTIVEGTGLAMADRIRMRLAALDREGDELYCRYVLE